MATPRSEGNGKKADTATQAAWAIMVYIAADGDLANFAVESLKQLDKFARTTRSPAPKIIVGAQFAFDTSGTEPEPPKEKTLGEQTKTARHFIFTKSSGRDSDANNKIRKVLKPADQSEPASISQKEALTRFLQSVYKDRETRAKQYALILWGHGPELLLQPAVSDKTGHSDRMYITPEELREVLSTNKPPAGGRLKIIGFDACFMSMLEMACELKGLAPYMVASQDEVPDASFPYGKLAELFRTHATNMESLLTDGVDDYRETYGQYIFGPSTGLNPITLSALRLNECDKLKEAVGGLTTALLAAPIDRLFLNALIEARQKSRDYASGLYVDLFEFCTNLSNQPVTSTIKERCATVLGELGRTKGLILRNVSADGRSHGISIYLPYLTDQQYAQVSRPLVKGGPETHTAKGFGDALNGAAIEYLMCARRDLILDTESYYGCLKLADETRWYSFIADLWTRALMEIAPAELDYHYSAQQSWMNTVRPKKGKATPCADPTSRSLSTTSV